MSMLRVWRGTILSVSLRNIIIRGLDMEHFNRYSTDLKNMDSAYSQYSHFSLSPSDYGVSEEECTKYLNLLKNAQQRNQEKNKNRKECLRTLLICVSIILAMLPVYVIYVFNDLPYIVLWFIVAGTWWSVLYIFCKVIDKIENNNVIYMDLFPPINRKVEHLFDDYLKRILI